MKEVVNGLQLYRGCLESCTRWQVDRLTVRPSAKLSNVKWTTWIASLELVSTADSYYLFTSSLAYLENVAKTFHSSILTHICELRAVHVCTSARAPADMCVCMSSLVFGNEHASSMIHLHTYIHTWLAKRVGRLWAGNLHNKRTDFGNNSNSQLPLAGSSLLCTASNCCLESEIILCLLNKKQINQKIHFIKCNATPKNATILYTGFFVGE